MTLGKKTKKDIKSKTCLEENCRHRGEEVWSGREITQNPQQRESSRWRQPAVQGFHQRSPPFSTFSQLSVSFFPLSMIHPPLTKPWRYCKTPRAQLLSGLIKRSRQILAALNKSSGQRFLLTPPREFIFYALWSCFRSWCKTTEERNKESVAGLDHGYRGVYRLIWTHRPSAGSR